MLHLWSRAGAVRGQAHFDEVVTGLRETPYLLFFEVVFILLPLLFHAGYGLKITFEGRFNVGRYPYSRNWMYVMQRVTGIVALLFIGYHFYEFRLQVLLGKLDSADLFAELCGSMSATISGGVPLRAIAYLIGVAATVFHFANGLWSACLGWGLTVSRRSQRLAGVGFGLLGLFLFFMGANTVVYFATGSKLPVPGMPATQSDAISCTDLGG